MELFKRLVILLFLVLSYWSCTDEDSVEQQLAEQEFVLSASGEEGEDGVDDEKDKNAN